MHHLHMEHFAMIDSPVHRVDVRVKVVVTLAYIIVVTAAPVGWPTVVAVLFPAALIGVSHVPPVYLLKRSALVFPFVLVAAVFMPFLSGEHILWETTMFGQTVHITREGLRTCAGVCVKAFLCMLTLLVLTATTRFALMLKALHSMKVPAVLVLLISFIYRYLFVLFDQTVRMKRARDARCAGRRSRAGGAGGPQRFRVAASMIGSLFLRTYARAERVYAAMLARGFSGEIHTMTQWRLGWRDAVFVAIAVAYLGLLGLAWKGVRP